MNTLECISSRVSVRSFTSQSVERSKLDTICRAGLEAPTAMNSRDIVLTVVTGKTLKLINEAMQISLGEETAKRFIQDGKFEFYRGGNALIVVSLGRKSVMPEQNTGCIIENMYLAATELGLGACWINQFYDFTDEKIRTLLELKEGYRPYAALTVGYTDIMPDKKERDGKIVYLD